MALPRRKAAAAWMAHHHHHQICWWKQKLLLMLHWPAAPAICVSVDGPGGKSGRPCVRWCSGTQSGIEWWRGCIKKLHMPREVYGYESGIDL